MIGSEKNFHIYRPKMPGKCYLEIIYFILSSEIGHNLNDNYILRKI